MNQSHKARAVELIIRFPIFVSLVSVLALFVTPTATGVTSSVSGVITHRISSCDYFIVQTRSGFDILEWMGGHDPDKGDVVIGRYEEYGSHDVLDDTADETFSVYTEEYWLSKSDALEKLADKCE